MKAITNILDEIGSGVVLFIRSVCYLPTLPRQFGRFIEQCFSMGYASLPLIGLLSFFIGAVLALQTAYGLQGFGVDNFLGTIVGLSVVRELGPVMTAFLVAGRIGSAITAELATMKVYQEVDALRTMNIPPERFLVFPRIAAIAVVMPVLTVVSIIIGWIGGAVIAENVAFIDVSSDTYFRYLKDAITVNDLMDGLIKAEIFGLFIVAICCNTGLRTKGGPREIGYSVTRAVVASMISILLLDYFVTRVLL